MKKYKVNYDRKKPSSEEILSRRDFDGLMTQYNAAPGKVVHKPFWKAGWFIGSVTTLAVVVSAVVIYNNKENSNPKQNQVTPIVQTVIDKKDSLSIQNNSVSTNSSIPTKRKISPPIPSLQIHNFTYKFNAAKGCTFTHTSGTKVSFPANAFVDGNGKSVTGNVEIQYREFRDQADFFLSGIPMQYDSLGKTYQFESAGMMQISGSINGKEVFLNKNKSVKIEFASKNTGTQYNVYKFDTLAGNWNFIGKDAVMTSLKADTSLAVQPFFEDHFDGPPTEPFKPLKVDAKKNRFTVAIDPLEFPEMKQYKDMIFQVDETNQKFNKNWYAVSWESIKLSYGSGVNKYKIALTKGKDIVMLDVFPVLDDRPYAEAMVKYNKDFADYSKKLSEYNAWADAKKREVLSGGPLTPEQKINNAKMTEVYRTFQVSGFGIYNMDCPAAYPQGAQIALTINAENGTVDNSFSYMFLADRNKLALYNFYFHGSTTEFHFNPRSSNLVWAVKDGALFYADNDQISKLPSEGKGTITMKAVKKDFKSPEEMKKFFRIGQGF